MTELHLDSGVLEAMQGHLPSVAARTVSTLIAEVDEYRGALAGPMGATISQAVELALGTFLRLAAEPGQGGVVQAALDGAYNLGRGEARSGRTMDALLAAYRVGARVSWRELSEVAVAQGLQADHVARFAELVFDYIDELSAASAAGHRDELATSGRVREQYLERLARALLDGATPEALAVAAGRADWTPPRTLTAVLVPLAQLRSAAAALPPLTLVLPLDDDVVLLVPDARRRALLASLRGLVAVVGPTRPWTDAQASYDRAVRAQAMGLSGDTDAHLTALVLGADPGALADLRAQALAPLADLRPAVAERLAETLRSWLLHQGRREDVAADLHVHPQTVRYRMTQLRELYAAELADPEAVLRLTLALALPSAGAAGTNVLS